MDFAYCMNLKFLRNWSFGSSLEVGSESKMSVDPVVYRNECGLLSPLRLAMQIYTLPGGLIGISSALSLFFSYFLKRAGRLDVSS
jgi:hypothetical protein